MYAYSTKSIIFMLAGLNTHIKKADIDVKIIIRNIPDSWGMRILAIKVIPITIQTTMNSITKQILVLTC
jgi:hypothetical protein